MNKALLKINCLSMAFLMVMLTGAYALKSSDAETARASNRMEILVLHSYHKNFPWTDGMDMSIMSVLQSQLPDCEVRTEYMDTKHVVPESVFPLLHALYKKKFENKKFDVLIVTDDNALNFIAAHGKDLFTGVPVVFCGVNRYPGKVLSVQKNITGVVEDYDLKSTINAALQIHKTTRNIAVINDTVYSAKLHMKKLRKVISTLTRPVEFIMLDDLTSNEIKTALKQLPDHTIVLQLSFYKTKDGRNFSVQEGGTFISSNCRFPVYSSWDSLIGSGIVGGMMVSSKRQGESAANMAVEILRGKPVSDIPVLKTSPNQFIFDYAIMEKYGIKKSDLPKDSLILKTSVALK